MEPNRTDSRTDELDEPAPLGGDEPLRVVLLVQKRQRRGAEVFARDLGGALRDRGFAVRVVYLYDYRGDAPLALDDDDVALDGDEHHPLERLIGFNPRLLARVRREISAFRPHVVQANGARTIKYGALARRLARPPWALVYRNIGDPSAWITLRRHALFYRRIVMPQLDGIVGVSQATLDTVERFYDLDIPTRQIPRAIDVGSFVESSRGPSARQALGAGVGDPVALFVGSLTTEKRPDRLLRVFEGVSRDLPDARLWVVGEGSLHDDVAAQAARAGLGERVALLGARSDVPSLMAAADLLLLTSDTEGIPGVVLEAAAVGLPVLATAVGGVSECVEDGVTGVLVAPEDEAGLVAAARRLLSDEPARAAMGEAARELVERRFSLAAAVDDYLDFYQRVVQRVA